MTENKNQKNIKEPIEIYDGLNGVIEAFRGETEFEYSEPRQKDLLGARVRLCIGKDNKVVVRSVSIIRKGKDYKGDECPVLQKAKEIRIMPPDVAFASIL